MGRTPENSPPPRSHRRSPIPDSADTKNKRDRRRSASPESKKKEKEVPNYNQSGLLGQDQNTVKGTALKYSEPVEARKPTEKWRIYVFKGEEEIDLLHIHRQSAYLFGRERKVVDIPIDHHSCSKQHAVLQFRQVVEKDETGSVQRVIKPYLIDLESTNGSFVNGEKIPESRYFELKVGDTLKFGFSSRDYVLMHEEV